MKEGNIVLQSRKAEEGLGKLSKGDAESVKSLWFKNE